MDEEEFHGKVDAYIYVTGGRIRGKTLGYVERYHCGKRLWERKTSLVENRGSHGSGAIGEKLLVVGGGGFRSNLHSLECLDCSTGEWKVMSPMPTARHALITVVIGRSLYVIGGWINGSISSTDLERYDIDCNQWTTCTPMPTGRRLLGAAGYMDQIYVFGGIATTGHCKTVEIYDIASNTWRTGPDLPLASQASAVAIADYLYVILHGDSIWRFDPRTMTYLKLAELPLQRWFCFDATVVNDRLYLAGGNVEGVWSGELWSYDVFLNKWEKLPSMSKERRRCCAAAVLLPKPQPLPQANSSS
eukprot:scaffold326_cov169-Ochromonas_danica.AAC.11